LFRLLEAINFGSKSAPELKIKGLAETYMQIKDDQKRFDGNIHVGQLVRFVDGDHVEFTYHKDGAVLAETILPSGEKEHYNVYGTGERWTPIDKITTYQPVMVIQILSLADYRPAFIEEKYGLRNYVVKNDHFFKFDRGQGIMALIYLRHKDYPLARYCFENNYSDVLMKFGENLELCIFIQRQMHPDNVDSMIRNSFRFVDRLDGYEYISSALCNHVFDKVFVDFMNIVQEGDKYFDISKTMMQVIESVDPFYQSLRENGSPIYVHKPMLVRRLLDTLDGMYDGYLRLAEEDRMMRVITLYAEMLAEIQGEKPCGDAERMGASD
jgi:hypothetical protein